MSWEKILERLHKKGKIKDAHLDKAKAKGLIKAAQVQRIKKAKKTGTKI
ncbi:MAG: hypothetical protein KAQ68_10040 [Clostridiales bacterium]|nr:hypothetical protein [Clostridiales bacterium]